MDKRIEEVINYDRYGKFAPVFQELLARMISEYDLPIEYVDRFANHCKEVVVEKIPDNKGSFLAFAQYEKNRILISKDYMKQLEKNPSPENYEYFIHVINHEMTHFLNDAKGRMGMNASWNEAFTEVAASRTTYGKNKDNLYKYRDKTNGYGDFTFGVNILASIMGISEKKLLQENFNHNIQEILSKQFHQKSDAEELLNGIGAEMNKIHRAVYYECKSPEERKKIRTEAYYNIYRMR